MTSLLLNSSVKEMYVAMHMRKKPRWCQYKFLSDGSVQPLNNISGPFNFECSSFSAIYNYFSGFNYFYASVSPALTF